MKLILQNSRIAGTATDEYTGPDEFISAPVDFDFNRLAEYVVMDGVASLPVLPDAVIVAVKISALWQAADVYVSASISGVAIGILTMGTLQQKPKCLAVTQWSAAVWAEYYKRKALVTPDSVDDLDFSVFGPMPYSVPELQSEVFGGSE